MARLVSVPITDHGTACSNGYIVRFKPSASLNWTTLNGLQQPRPDIVSTSPLVIDYYIDIPGLSDNTQYDIGITRQCCDDTLAAETTAVFTTGS